MSQMYAYFEQEGELRLSALAEKQQAEPEASPIAQLANRKLSEKLEGKLQPQLERKSQVEPRRFFSHLNGEPSLQKRIDQDPALLSHLQTRIKERKGGQ